MSEWRDCVKIQRRDHFHASATREKFIVLRLAPLALLFVASEQNNDGVEVGAGGLVCPVVRMICSCVAESLRTGSHALLEFR